jgi:endonuclease/exonuclease/phosphatase family metal-dependent hydrolase
MKKVNRTVSFLYLCFVLYTLLVYALLYWFPFSGWISGFMMMSFPVVIIIHFLSLLFLLSTNRRKSIVPLAMLLTGGFFLPRTFSFRADRDVELSSGDRFISVMSYNVHGFQLEADRKSEEGRARIDNMKTWIAGYGADVLCMPEYISYSGSGSMDIKGAFEKEGYVYQDYLNETKWNRPHSYYGMAVFSRLPIVARADTLFEMQNGMVRVDVKAGKDTIRIISVHLFSMTLKLNTLKNQRTAKGVAREGKVTAGLLKRGFTNHAREVLALESWIRDSPYPVIVCGDFNETPYSYVYGKIRSQLNNAFEEKGSGFGFTFNQLPYFIRIDHQFYSADQLEIVNFKTPSVRFSDHYPLIGTYKILDGKQQ